MQRDNAVGGNGEPPKHSVLQDLVKILRIISGTHDPDQQSVDLDSSQQLDAKEILELIHTTIDSESGSEDDGDSNNGEDGENPPEPGANAAHYHAEDDDDENPLFVATREQTRNQPRRKIIFGFSNQSDVSRNTFGW